MLIGKTPGVGSSEAPGDGAGTGAGKLSAEEKQARRLKLWAFGTSPHGLGLSPEAFWCLTYAEFSALRDVHEAPIRRWAIEQAAFHNANFKTDEVPWIADDFMGRGDREKRRAEMLRDKRELMKVNSKLAIMKPGQRPEGLPDFWPKPKKRA